MKRLLYISQSDLPSQAANSVHVMKMAQAFARTGLAVTLVAAPGTPPMAAAELHERYAVDPVFDFHLVRRPGGRRGAIGYTLRALSKAFPRRDTLIYTRLPMAAALASALGWQAIVELHHPTNSRRELRAYLRLARRPLIVVITEALRQKVIADLSCDPDQVIVAPDGADPIPPDTQPVLPPVEPGRLRVGFLGHLYRGKGMEVITAIAPQCPWADFEVVGGTKEDIAYWQGRTADCPNIRFRGYIPHALTPGYLNSFDVAMLPNQNFIGTAGNKQRNISMWTSPLKAFEYMAAGLPIIASDQPNLREVLQHDTNAILCPPDDFDAWRDALVRLRDSDNLRLQLGQSAYNSFSERYSWSARAAFLMEACLFDRVVETEQRQRTPER